MITKKLTVINESGIHARPASVLVKECAKFKSNISFTYAGKTHNAKSIINVMGCGVKKGAEIEMTFEGEDEAQAAKAVEAAINAGLGE